ncbi:MAG: nuclear transport factor 2 family protein, partial [Acidobacteria bacterium]|nr:nuclear transport factor 2 family protein [Acidobacteriota bacterium]
MLTNLTLFSFGLMTGPLVQETSKADILAVISQYESALNGRNVKQILKLYGQNPTFMPQHAPAQEGRDAVKQAYVQVFETIRLHIQFSIHEVEVLGDTAWARTSSAGKTTILANNAVVNEGN